ncbi:hypothetical protein H9Q70_010486 [Fusarium xylarioides]|nr:hypothetical protein H9Q70_010486 [Fusarium xylarioides]
MQPPTPKSLHRLSIDNPWFAVHPLFWTLQHLRLLHCHFQHLDSAITTASSPSSVADKDLTLHSRRLAKIRSPIVKSISVGHLLCHQGSPLEKVGGSPPFLFAGRVVHLPECHVFQVRATGIQQRPVVGYYHYNNIARERQRALTPKSHPTGGYNYPVSRIYQRRLRNVAPALWFEDPYLARLLVTNKSDTTHAHIFQADIPYDVLETLDHPTLDMENIKWPTIRHIQVPFEPYSSFAERTVVQLVDDEYKPDVKTQASMIPRGEKRKRDESDAMGQRRNVKSLDSMRLAAVSLANG